MVRVLCLATMFMLLAAPVGVMASDYAAFTKDLAAPYSEYKKSLSLTSKKEDAEKAQLAIAAFVSGWEKLAAKYGKDVPTVFAATKDFPAVIARPVAVGKEAQALVKNGDVKAAHAVLEEVRYLMWNLRATNRIVALADKANNFHEALESVLDRSEHAKESAGLLAVEERFGPWLAVSWEEIALAPASETSAPGFPVLLQDGRASIAALRAALRSGDRAAVKQQANAVKNAYKKVFFMD